MRARGENCNEALKKTLTSSHVERFKFKSETWKV